VHNSKVIKATKYWLENIIIEFNFCPFAKREFVNETIHYQVSEQTCTEGRLCEVVEQLKYLDLHKTIETSLVIIPTGLESFFDYLDLLSLAEETILQLNYEGVYQLASFHPDYCFEDLKQNDAANYTNRSPYPMIHILRESSLEKAIEFHENPELIPEANIKNARAKGSETFKKILKDSLG